MKSKKLKPYVLPCLYVMIIGALIISITFLNQSLYNEEPDFTYSVSSIDDDEVIPVISETPTKPMKPYTGENISIGVNYYSKDDEIDIQKNSLIYYQNTYMQNTGVLYSNEEVFDVTASLDGIVKNISDNEILGKTIELTHNNNLSTFYYSLSETSVNVGDEVKMGNVIGKSGDNKIENRNGSSLLFEVYYNGKTLDPENFYKTNLTDLQ